MNYDIELNSLYICVKDMDRAVRFYEAILNHKVDMKDDVASFFILKEFRFMLFHNQSVNEKVVYGDNCLPSFQVSNMESFLEKLEELNAPIEYPLTRINDNLVLEFKDPEGNDIEVYSRV